MEHHNKHDDDKPIGAPHMAEEETNEGRAFEINNPKQGNQPQKPRKTWANMPLWKKMLVIWFSIVCAFGVYDTLFPSEKSLKLEELLPIIATPTPTASTTPTTLTPTISPTPLISPTPPKK